MDSTVAAAVDSTAVVAAVLTAAVVDLAAGVAEALAAADSAAEAAVVATAAAVVDLAVAAAAVAAAAIRKLLARDNPRPGRGFFIECGFRHHRWQNRQLRVRRSFGRAGGNGSNGTLTAVFNLL